jgi:uncharacterized protein YoxC
MIIRGLDDVITILNKQQKEIKSLNSRVEVLEKENKKLLNKSTSE